MGRGVSYQLVTVTPTFNTGWAFGAISTLLLGSLYHISDRLATNHRILLDKLNTIQATMATVDRFQEHTKRMDDKFEAINTRMDRKFVATDLKITMLEKHMDSKLDELKRLITEKRY